MLNNDMERLFGRVRRWKEGDRLFAENDWFRGAYVVTDNRSKVGSMGLHGPDQICVEFISAEKGKLWE